MQDPEKFRAVIVGGGLVGLTAAHVFTKVGIDFMIQEKHNSVLTARGTDLAVWPQTMRVFDQLNLLNAIDTVLNHCNDIMIITSKDGRIIRSDRILHLIEKNHGHAVRLMARPQMVTFLHESLPQYAKNRILLGKQVTGIEVLEDGVNVTCEDGTSHRGSIVIGADGVRSQVRLFAQALKAGRKPKELPQAVKTPFITTYRFLFANIPILPGLQPNTTYNGIHQGMTTQIINGTNTATFGVYEKLDAPTSVSMRYSLADCDAFFKRCAHLYMAPNVTVSQVYEHRVGDPVMIDLEEGVVDQWFHKRIVLVGDAVRKLEPHLGLGYNSGVADVVVLANHLRLLLQQDAFPGTTAIEKTFASYHRARIEQTRQMSNLSEQGIRLMAWLNWKHMVVGRYVLTLLAPLAGFIVTKTISPVISQTPVLDGLEEKNLPKSLVPWKYHPDVKA